jgi:phosphate transport system substrate-binding protein
MYVNSGLLTSKLLKAKQLHKVFIGIIAYSAAIAFGNTYEATSLDNFNKSDHLFTIKGSNTIGAKLAPELVKAYLHNKDCLNVTITSTNITNETVVKCITRNHSNIRVNISAHGSSTGFKSLLEGSSDIAASSRPIKPKEQQYFKDIDLSDINHEFIAAIDGLPIITHPDNPIDALTTQQLGQIFSGKINNWASVGGKNQTIIIHARDNNSGTFDTFKTKVLKDQHTLSSNSIRYESNQILSEAVTKQPGSIGFTAFSNIGSAKVIAIKDGSSTADSQPLSPNLLNIVSEDYPLSRRLYFYKLNQHNLYANEFIHFVESQKGQDIVKSTGFASQNIIPSYSQSSLEMPRGYQHLSESSFRLSVNFRFNPHSHELDNKAKKDVYRLAKFMSENENKSKELVLVGFSNNQKNGLRGRLLSQLRLSTVRKALAELDIHANAMTGYGNLNAVANNDNQNDSQKNHRVEVWIR